MLIKISKSPALESIIPGRVKAIQPFEFDGVSFSPSAETLEPKIFGRKIQEQSLALFIKKPNRPQVYICSSQPDDSHASLLAAFLVEQHINKIKNSNVIWEHLSAFHDSQLSLEPSAKPTLIVISTCYENMTFSRIERVRDIVNAFYDVPKIIVASGIDPISLAAYKLHIPVHAIYYSEDPIMKSKLA